MRRPSLVPLVVMAAIVATAGCVGAGGDAQVTVSTAPPASEAGSARRLVIADASLDTTVSTHAAFDARAALDAASIAFRRVDGGHLDPGDDTGRQEVATFYLGYFELTQGQWRTLAQAAGVGDDGKVHPWRALSPAEVVGVVEEDARPLSGASALLVQQVLDAWNSQRAPGQPTLRLPTMQEWEYASRPEVPARYTWGDSEALHHVTGHAVVHETRTARGADVVGGRGATRRLPNAHGLFDLHGNVWEMVDAGDGDAVLMGGSWSDNLTSARLGVQTRLDRETPHALAGVRLVLVVP